MLKPRIGLLPCYLALYDKTDPPRRDRFAPLLTAVTDGFTRAGLTVDQAPICCIAAEFKDAVTAFELGDVDVIVLLHLAYSPSLESAATLTATSLPLLFLDTTMDYAFNPGVEASRISYNHGIHGVQDLASVLRRYGKDYEIVAGHLDHSDVLARAANTARALAATKAFRGMRVLRIGESFTGMGDFAVPDAQLHAAFGIHVDTLPPDALADHIAAVSDDELEAELKSDRETFQVAAPEEIHAGSARVGLGLRRLLDTGGYGAFSMNFMAFDTPEPPVNAVPFVEACKAMARGLGYAGEGDVLTATLVGAWSAAFGRTTFTEPFCPDWEGDALFMFHMGEVNPEIAAQRPRLVELDFPYTDARNTTSLACDYAAGAATLLNLAPGPKGTFALIAAPVEVFGEAEREELKDCVRGWIKPDGKLVDFLEAYSRHGGTHHVALIYGDRRNEVRVFGNALGVPVEIL